MTAPEPGWIRTHLLEVTVVVIAVTTAIAGIAWARQSAPDQPLDAIAVGSAQPGDARIRAITCQRTLPEASGPAEEQAEQVAREASQGRVQSAQVLACPDAFDQMVVDYVGEVVGDILRRPGGAWLLVNDDAYALESGPLAGHGNFAGANQGLAVWVPTELAGLVDEPGNAQRRGDVVEVVGRIHRADPDDGGGLTLRASSLEVLVEAQPVPGTVNGVQALVAGLLTLVALAVLVWGQRTGRLTVPGSDLLRRLTRRR